MGGRWCGAEDEVLGAVVCCGWGVAVMCDAGVCAEGDGVWGDGCGEMGVGRWGRGERGVEDSGGAG